MQFAENAAIRYTLLSVRAWQQCQSGVHQICREGVSSRAGSLATDDREAPQFERRSPPVHRLDHEHDTHTMKVERRDGESVEQLIRRFNKGVISERITKTFREKMHFVSKSEQRKEKRRRAERNRRKKAAKGF